MSKAQNPTPTQERVAIKSRLAKIADQIAAYLENPRTRTPEKLLKLLEERIKLEKRLLELNKQK